MPETPVRLYELATGKPLDVHAVDAGPIMESGLYTYDPPAVPYDPKKPLAHPPHVEPPLAPTPEQAAADARASRRANTLTGLPS